MLDLEVPVIIRLDRFCEESTRLCVWIDDSSKVLYIF